MEQFETKEQKLLAELEIIDSILNSESLIWREIRSSLNMLRNKNRRHYGKIKRKLFMDFRMIEDHQITIEGLNGHLDEAYELAEFFETDQEIDR